MVPAFCLMAGIGAGSFLSDWTTGLAVLALVSGSARFGAYLSTIAVCVLGILTPGTLINLCRMSDMHCRAVMQPAMIILFSVSGLAAAVGAWMSGKGKA